MEVCRYKSLFSTQLYQLLVNVLLQEEEEEEVVSVGVNGAADGFFFPISQSPHTNEALMKKLNFTK